MTASTFPRMGVRNTGTRATCLRECVSSWLAGCSLRRHGRQYVLFLAALSCLSEVGFAQNSASTSMSLTSIGASRDSSPVLPVIDLSVSLSGRGNIPQQDLLPLKWTWHEANSFEVVGVWTQRAADGRVLAQGPLSLQVVEPATATTCRLPSGIPGAVLVPSSDTGCPSRAAWPSTPAEITTTPIGALASLRATLLTSAGTLQGPLDGTPGRIEVRISSRVLVEQRALTAKGPPPAGPWERGGVSGAFPLTSSGAGATASIPWPPVSAFSLSILDPVPELVAGPSITTNVETLSSLGRAVAGVAADGVARLILRASVAQEGQSVSFSIDTSDCVLPTGSITDVCGGLQSADGRLQNQQFLTAIAVNTSRGPMAFAVYRAPSDFSWTSAHEALTERQIRLTVTSSGQSQVKSIRVIRPPIALVHGNWSDQTAWDFFRPLSDNSDSRFQAFRTSYGDQIQFGVSGNVPKFLDDIETIIQDFASLNQVAVARASVVAHSMGGLIARAAGLDARSSIAPFASGYIHKLITLDTPHLGSEFAARLLAQSDSCRRFFEANKMVVAQNIKDLSPGSDVLLRLKAGKVPPIHVVVGTASSAQIAAAENSAGTLRTSWSCPGLLPPGGFATLFGMDSDLIVSKLSQSAGLTGSAVANLPGTEIIGVIHTVVPNMFTRGPDILGRGISGLGLPFFDPTVDSPERDVIVRRVIDVLNTPAISSAYAKGLP